MLKILHDLFYKLTPKMALSFLDSLMDVDNDSEAQRKRLIDRFVKKVIVYNNRIDIYLSNSWIRY